MAVKKRTTHRGGRQNSPGAQRAARRQGVATARATVKNNRKKKSAAKPKTNWFSAPVTSSKNRKRAQKTRQAINRNR